MTHVISVWKKKAALSLLDCFKYQSVYVNDRRKLKRSAPPVSELRPGKTEYGVWRVICNLSGIGRSGKAGNIRPETAHISSLHSISEQWMVTKPNILNYLLYLLAFGSFRFYLNKLQSSPIEIYVEI